MSSPPSAGERLDSWKEIAAYLKRDARTVRRWEKSEGLPVHRHVHRKKPTVYAYKHELDAWWNNRQPRLALENDMPPAVPTPRRRWALVGGLVALLAAVSLFVVTVPTGEMAYRGENENEPSSVPVVQKVFHDDSLAGSCCVLSVSPNGRFLGYTDVDFVNVGVIDLTRMDERVVIRGGSEGSYVHSNPIFAPDSERVAYTWARAPARVFELRVTDLWGPTRTVHRTDDVQPLPLAWSPDGFIVAPRKHPDGTQEIILVSAADGSVRFVKNFVGPPPTHMSFSPDGNRLAYARAPDGSRGTNDLFLLAVDGGAEARLTDHPGDDTFPVWLRDGSGIFFLSDRTGAVDAWLLPMSGDEPAGVPRILHRELGNVIPIALTDDGDFYYKRWTGLVDVRVAEVDPLTGAIVAPPETIPTRFSGTNMMPSWSPDGRFLAFLSRRGWISSQWVLVIQDIATGAERVLSEMRYVRQPRWAPWGESLLVRGVDRDGREGTFEIDPLTGNVLRHVLEGMEPFAVWSADGASLFYKQNDRRLGNGRLYRRDLRTGEDEELLVTTPPSWIGNRIALSRDGRFLAFTRHDPPTSSITLGVLSIAEGKHRELIRVEAPESILVQDWSADGRFVLVRHSGPDGDDSQWALSRVSVEDGNKKDLLRAEGIRNVRAHPDGRRIAFTAGWPLVELFVMKNAVPLAPGES